MIFEVIGQAIYHGGGLSSCCGILRTEPQDSVIISTADDSVGNDPGHSCFCVGSGKRMIREAADFFVIVVQRIHIVHISENKGGKLLK